LGGRGGIGLTLLGALTIGYLEKILSINAVGESSRLMLTGAIIVAAVLLQRRRSRLSRLPRSPNATPECMKSPSSRCSQAALSAPTSAGRAPGTGPGEWIIGVSQCNLGEPWRVQMNADIRRAAEAHPEVELVFKDAQNDTLRQRAQIEEFVNADVDLLIVSPKEAAPLTLPVAAAFQHGIPVIVLDRKVLGGNSPSSSAPTTAGSATGRRRMGGRAPGGAPPGQGRREGPHRRADRADDIDARPGPPRRLPRGASGPAPVDIVFSADMQWLEPQARTEMESALAVNPQIDLVYAHNDPSAHGAYLAAKAAGSEKDILFVGIDGLPQEGQVYVRQGLLAASFEYPTGGSRGHGQRAQDTGRRGRSPGR
jgi:ribose transport system substrate-binding protein